MSSEFITPIVTIASTIVGSASVFTALYWVHSKSDDRWAAMQKEWHETQKEIVSVKNDILGVNKELLKISQRVERLEDKVS